ncbi:MAG TPA: methylaspartate mutase accessory protein GlmL [Thermodesulfobacteriota bacterium]|nr:methylaspartate mutase accessory protein GlmL [Thermodesulfobacteriota bacterium]
MSLALLIDFGSTFTKILAVDLGSEEILAYAQSGTTVATDIMVGLGKALDLLPPHLKNARYECKLSSSSAAGGLAMVTIGLVPELSAEAARRAALGAGAKVVKVYSFRLSQKELKELETLSPDILLLAGGSDGGNSEIILENARILAQSALPCPILIAGNKAAADEVNSILSSSGKGTIITDNVMPEVNVLNVEPARQKIRQVFIDRIIEAKGLKRAEQFVEGILMPTPTAVLNAARLLSAGVAGEPGMGDILIVDVGGATTDVHSVGAGNPLQAGVIRKGLPEPMAKRTVEGDLGLRYNAETILKLCGREKILKHARASHADIAASVAALSRSVETVPGSEEERDLDFALAACAARTAMERHAGTIETLWGPQGQYYVQYGKDLTGFENLIGTGGIFIHHPEAGDILARTLYSPEEPFSLRPRDPAIYTDARYCLYAVGLLAERYPEKAFRIGKKYLKKWN